MDIIDCLFFVLKTMLHGARLSQCIIFKSSSHLDSHRQLGPLCKFSVTMFLHLYSYCDCIKSFPESMYWPWYDSYPLYKSCLLSWCAYIHYSPCSWQDIYWSIRFWFIFLLWVSLVFHSKYIPQVELLGLLFFLYLFWLLSPSIPVVLIQFSFWLYLDLQLYPISGFTSSLHFPFSFSSMVLGTGDMTKEEVW